MPQNATPNDSLLDRYLHAVGRYLPARSRQDILTELATNLHAEADHQATQLQRPLTEEEQVAILRRQGRPAMVAARYGPQRSLIGPEIFPLYAYVLEHGLPLIIAIFILIRAARLVWAPAPFSGLEQAASMTVAIFRGLPSTILFFLAIVTALFAIVEVTKDRLRQPWDPRRLPRFAPAQAFAGSRHPCADAVLTALFLSWLLLFPHYPRLLFSHRVAWHLLSLDLPLIWHRFYWLLTGVIALHLALKLSVLPAAMRRYAGLAGLIGQALGIALALYFLRARDYIGQGTIGGTNLSPQLTATINHGIHAAVWLVLLVELCRFVWDAAHWLRPELARRQTVEPKPLSS
jgi:hypothetical protein